MKGSYIEPTKQYIFEDWRRFAKLNLLPHTQTCTRCNMVIQLDKLSDITTLRHRDNELFYTCLGCGKFEKFGGGSHLSVATITCLAVRWDNASRDDTMGFFKYDAPVLYCILVFSTLSAVVSGIGLFVGNSFL